jgi:hypothetical protein
MIGFFLKLSAPLHEASHLKTAGKLKFLFDAVSALLVVNLTQFRLRIFKLLDRGFLEFMGPYGLSQSFLAFSTVSGEQPKGVYIASRILAILGIVMIVIKILAERFSTSFTLKRRKFDSCIFYGGGRGRMMRS